MAFFGLALGVANNRNMPTFTRFNAQQAILLDILQVRRLAGPTLCLCSMSAAPLTLPCTAAMDMLCLEQILPDLLLGNKGPAPGNDFLIQATIITSNTVFIYVYLCCLAGVSRLRLPAASVPGRGMVICIEGGGSMRRRW